MAITFYDEVSNPTDNGTYTTSPAVITPPSGMQAGDLVILQACMAATSGTASISQAGGQTWNSLTQRNATRNRARVFWCRFNGTWTANPSVTLSSGANNIIRMMVWRPTGGTLSTWAVDVAEVSTTYAAPSDPWTVTINEIVTNYDNSLVIALWSSADDNTWDSLTSGWTALDPVQVRNTSGTYDQSVTAAWKIQEFHGATGNVSQNQATLGGDVGTYCIIAFREIEQHAGGAASSGSGAIAGSGKKSGLRSLVSSGKGALAVIGMAGMLATSAISGGGSVTATSAQSGQNLVKVINETLQPAHFSEGSGLAAFSGGGSIVALGQKGGQGVTVVSGNGSVAATIETGAGTATAIQGGGSLIATGQKNAKGASEASGSGSVAASHSPSRPGSAAVSGGGNTAALGSPGHPSGSAISGKGSLAGSGLKAAGGLSSVSGGGSIVATGTRAMAIVKVINEQLQPWYRPMDSTAFSGGGSLAASGKKGSSEGAAIHGGGAVGATGGQPSFQIVKVINETLQRYVEGNPIVKVINETLSPPPHSVEGSSAASVSGGGSVTVSGQRVGGIVKVINESVGMVEGSFLTSQEIVQVVNEPIQAVEAITTRPALGSASISGSGSLSALARKQVGGAAAISGRGETNAEYKLHARPVGISGSGSLVTTETSAHAVIASISGGGRVVVWRPAPVRSTYKKSFTRMRTGDPKMDRALQLIEEEFSRMIDYVNRKTG